MLSFKNTITSLFFLRLSSIFYAVEQYMILFFLFGSFMLSRIAPRHVFAFSQSTLVVTWSSHGAPRRLYGMSSSLSRSHAAVVQSAATWLARSIRSQYIIDGLTILGVVVRRLTAVSPRSTRLFWIDRCPGFRRRRLTS